MVLCVTERDNVLYSILQVPEDKRQAEREGVGVGGERN